MSEEVKTLDQLIAEGGKFYELNGESWCDTCLDSWLLIPGKGYVRYREPESAEQEPRP